jgi:uncharacterized membrane protein HdeD (DUF308 family)
MATSSRGATLGAIEVADAIEVPWQDWWALALRGALAIIAGLIALFFPGPTLAAFILLFSAYLLVDGVFALIAGFRVARCGERSWPLFLEGVADIAGGLIAFFWPGIALLALVYVVAVWAVVSGAFLIAAAFRPGGRREWLLALGGVISVIFGVLLALAPIAGAVVLAWWFGAYALAFGIVLLIVAFRLRRQRQRPEPLARAA